MFRYTPLALLCSAALVTTLSGCGQKNTETTAEVKTAAVQNPALWPELKSPVASADTEKRVQQLLATMTIEQKVAQLIQPDIRWMTVEDMRQYGFGSYLNGGGAYPNDNKNSTAADWVALAQAYYDAGVDASKDGSSIPPIWGTDAVHGHNNVIGATIFPHNIGLGAANNAQLVEAIGKATAVEVAATGINWIFAPTVEIGRAHV